MNAVSVKASGNTQKKMKMPALSNGIVTMPMEYLVIAAVDLRGQVSKFECNFGTTM